MKAKKLIDALDGCQAVANIINKTYAKEYSRQRIFNWYKHDEIPARAQIDFAKLWEKANRIANKI